MVVELVIAEVNEQIGKVIALFRDSQAQTLRDGLRYLVRVDADRVLARQTQVMGKASRQFLHKGVDGAHAKVAVVMHDLRHQALGVAFQRRIVDAQFFQQLGLHRLGVNLIAVDDIAQFLHDFGFHLVGCRIGEGDGQYVPEIGHRTLTGKA